jgi:nucleoside-diphosphate-sugar epimerase
LSVLLQGEGAVGTMTVSLLARPYAKFVEIYGTRGTIHADLVREVCILRRAWRVPRMVGKVLFSLEDSAQRALGTTANALNVALGRMPRMPELPVSIGQFYARIREGQEPPAPGTEGRRMIALMEEVWAKAPDLAAPSTRSAVAATAAPMPRTDVERRVAQEGSLPRRVLVTGATGYLGRHLVAALARCGAEVVAVVRDRSRVSRELEQQSTLVEADLDDAAALDAAMEGIDAVFHCAAVTRNNVPWEVHQATNIEGTRTVLAAAHKAGVGRVIHISSIVVYGLDTPPAGRAIDESACYAEDDDRWAHYLISKREADKLAFEFHREAGLPVTVIRPGVIYGPGGGRTVGRGLAEIGPLRLSIGAGRNALPFTYIDNLVDALLLAVTTPEAVGQAYNIVDNPAVPVRDYVAEGAAAAHERVVVLPVPPAMLTGVAGVLEGRQRRAGGAIPPRLSRFVVRSATSDIRYDATKAARELGWRPAVDWREGISRSLNGAA